MQVDFWLIYELCTEAERMPATSKFMWWWGQYVGREVERPGDILVFKIKCVGAVP